MFKRSDKTYDINPDILDGITIDETNPLNRIYRFIPEGSKVLDVGAGNGLLAQIFIKNNKKIIIDGIEPSLYASTIARKYYRHFHHGIAQKYIDIMLKENYDYIVLADVIEHMQNPFVFLQDLCSKLPVNTRLFLSVPNIAFGAVRISLLNGDFNYVDSGILEKTHVRFFTIKTITELVSKIDMNIEVLFYLKKNIFNSEISLKKSIRNVFLCLQMANDETFSTYQFLLVLTKNTVISTEKIYYGKNAVHRYIIC